MPTVLARVQVFRPKESKDMPILSFLGQLDASPGKLELTGLQSDLGILNDGDIAVIDGRSFRIRERQAKPATQHFPIDLVTLTLIKK